VPVPKKNPDPDARDKESGEKATKDNGGEKQPEKKPEVEVTEVEVICEGTLGPKLLKKGDRTSDPEYVALLDDPRDLVRAV
jgi:hypothetical protein